MQIRKGKFEEMRHLLLTSNCYKDFAERISAKEDIKVPNNYGLFRISISITTSNQNESN